MLIDVHGHFVPPAVLAAVEADPERYGISLERDEQGPRLRIGGEPPTRPLLPALRELEQRQQRLEAQGIRHQVLFTWLDIAGYSLPAEQGARWSRLQNESLAASLREHRDPARFSGLATVPLQDGARAANELEYAVSRLGMKGAVIASNIHGRTLDDPGLEPFWQQAEALGAPVLIHPVYVAGQERMRAYFLSNLVGNPLDTTLAAACLMFGGVIDRHPELQVILVHGGGCLPYVIGRLHWGYQVSAEARRIARKMPEEYLHWFHYDTLVYKVSLLRYLLQEVGAGRVLMGSDYPFDIGDPEPAKIVRAAGLPPAETDRVLGGNARALFHF
ncbi:MAG: amidohydrolase family protein [Deltaproteobacteria bacterium]|nr:amidohydrolase family protein [Deltaproteobacteria bacterium]